MFLVLLEKKALNTLVHKIVFLLFLLLACLWVFTRRQKGRLFFLAVVVIWIGFYTHDFLSIYHVRGLFNLHAVQPFSWWFGVLLAVSFITMLVGRAYCGWVCPFGALMYVFYKISPVKKQVPEKIHRFFTSLKYLLLFVGITVGAAGIILFKIEPFVYIFTGWIRTVFFGFAVSFILVSFIIPYFWCRYLCFLGAWWGLCSLKPALRYIVCWEKKKCGQCADVCPVGAIRKEDSTIIQRECIRCNECQVCRAEDKRGKTDGGMIQ